MPLLQETTANRDILSCRDGLKSDTDSTMTPQKNPLGQVAFPGFTNTAMFTPGQLLMASQIMAASGLALPPNPAFFHPTLFAAATAVAATSPWPASSPPSPPSSSTEQLSPALMKARKHNINNNIVTSSSNANGGGIIEPGITTIPKRKISKRIKLEEEIPLVSPTSSSTSPSPPGSLETRDAHRDKQFTCGVCNRSFGYKHVLQNHERTHTGEKPFECPECHKKFTRDHHLKTHMRLHTGERPYHCEHCDRQFVQVANLRRHLRVHTGERPYACEHCSAKFSDSNQLKAHILIHTNEKPFSCERCQSRFRRRHHLIHHKCGQPASTLEKELTSPITEPDDELRQQRKVLRAPLVSLPTYISIPEQTEPEDLSMSTGLNSHSSSGDSPLSRSPSSRDDPYEEQDYDMEDSKLFLQRRSSGAAVHHSVHS